MNMHIDLNAIKQFFKDNSYMSERNGYVVARDNKYNNENGDILINSLMKDINITLSLLPTNINKSNITEFFSNPAQLSAEFLCGMYQLIDPSWSINWVVSKTNNKIEHCYLQKEDIILDLELKVISTGRLYNRLFRSFDQTDVKKTKKYIESNPDLLLKYLLERKKIKLLDDATKSDLVKDIMNYIELNAKTEFQSHINNYYNLDSTNINVIFAILAQNRLYNIEHAYEKLCHPLVPQSTLEEIENNTNTLNDFFQMYIPSESIDYGYFSQGECYSLSTTYHIAHPEWDLMFGYQTTDDTFKHAWLQKGNIIYDPNARIITISDLYYKYFTLVKRYKLDDTINDLQRLSYYSFDYLSNPQYGWEKPTIGKIKEVDKMISMIREIADGTYFDKYVKANEVVKKTKKRL